MAEESKQPRRVRVERNIYRRASGVYEVGFKDGTGKQRWRTVQGGITAARAIRDQLLARRNEGEAIQPRTRLRFDDAASAWLDGPVQDLRPRTDECYRNALTTHLLPRFATRRLDSVSPDDLAGLVREMREGGLSESTIVIALGVVNRDLPVRGATARLVRQQPGVVDAVFRAPKAGAVQAAAHLRRRRARADDHEPPTSRTGPYSPSRQLTGARVSELLGLTWSDVRVEDVDDAEIEFAWQVDRRGQRRPTKTDGSARTVPIPRELALMLVRYKLASQFAQPDHFVFSTRTGGSLRQRNVGRALRLAQTKAVDEHGQPTFPVLHRGDTDERSRASSSWRSAVDAQLPAHGSQSRAPGRREHRRGRPAPRPSRRQRNPCRLRARASRRPAARRCVARG